MTTTPPTTSASSTPMARLVLRLQSRLHELGQNFMAWDAQGRPMSPGLPGNPLCRDVMHDPRCAPGAMGAAACQSLAQKSATAETAPCGGCILAVPVIRRRRALGVVTVCFPTRESLAEGSLGRHWRGLNPDGPALPPTAPEATRHSRLQAEDFLRLLSWLIESEQDADIAHSETE
jgi:hypothetical protein